MFGEYALYLDNKVVALVCDNQCFVKPTPGGRAFIGEVTEGFPYRGAKTAFLVKTASKTANGSPNCCRSPPANFPPQSEKALRMNTPFTLRFKALREPWADGCSFVLYDC